jgi:hypothetical protein
MDCPICYCEMNASNSVLTDCKHRFHRTCLEKWACTQDHLNCPMCRTDINPWGVLFGGLFFDATEPLFGPEPFYLPFGSTQDNRTSRNRMDLVSSE